MNLSDMIAEAERRITEKFQKQIKELEEKHEKEIEAKDDEIESLEEALKDIASKPAPTDETGACIYCGIPASAMPESVDAHYSDCAWRKANEVGQ